MAIGRMLTNLAVHACVGTIPIIGDIFDAFFRVNQRNMRIVRGDLGRTLR
jgi:predicted deacylase